MDKLDKNSVNVGESIFHVLVQAKLAYCTPAMREYGLANFVIQPVSWCTTQAEVSAAERFLIWVLGTMKFGYNNSPGGFGGKGSKKGNSLTEVQKAAYARMRENYWTPAREAARLARIGRPLSQAQVAGYAKLQGVSTPARRAAAVKRVGISTTAQQAHFVRMRALVGEHRTSAQKAADLKLLGNTNAARSIPNR